MNRLNRSLALLLAIIVTGACSDPNALLPAGITNTESELTLWSLSAGPLALPNAYSLEGGNGVRIWDGGIQFEFVFDENAAGQPVLIPRDALGLLAEGAVKPGLKPSNLEFDEMSRAPLNDYDGKDTIVVAVGERYFVRSTVSICSSLGVPIYGKIEILEHDAAAHTLKINTLANQNCGYRGLNPGIPKH